MKRFFGIFSVMIALVMLLSGCTEGGNVSERKDGMIGQTETEHDEKKDDAAHTTQHEESTDEEQKDDGAMRNRHIVRRR